MIAKVVLSVSLFLSVQLHLCGQVDKPRISVPLFGDPKVIVDLTHPPDLGIQAKRIAFGPSVGPCSDQLIDAVIADFVQHGAEVIDRQHLAALLKEHNFTLTEYVDPQSAAQLGKILGPALLIFVKVQRCATEKQALHDDSPSYFQKGVTVRTYISRTQSFFKASVQAVDLRTAQIFAAKTIENSPKRENKSQNCCPEFPSEHELSDTSLNTAKQLISRMFFAWPERKELVFFDDKDCGLKDAYELLKAGEAESCLRRSEENLEKCRSLPNVKDRSLARAYHNVGVGNVLVRQDYDRAVGYFRDAAKVRREKSMEEAIEICQVATRYSAQLRELSERTAKEAANTSAPAGHEDKPAKAAEARSLSVEDVIKMRQAGLSEDLIATMIRKEGRAYDLTVDEMLKLQNGGVTDSLIKMMLDPGAQLTPSANPQAPVFKKPAPKK